MSNDIEDVEHREHGSLSLQRFLTLCSVGLVMWLGIFKLIEAML